MAKKRARRASERAGHHAILLQLREHFKSDDEFAETLRALSDLDVDRTTIWRWMRLARSGGALPRGAVKAAHVLGAFPGEHDARACAAENLLREAEALEEKSATLFRNLAEHRGALRRLISEIKMLANK